MKALFGKYERTHLIGIGGLRMEGLARVLSTMGCRISGSDQTGSLAMDCLLRDGFAVHVGHRASHVQGADLVVSSPAVPDHNEELAEARRLGIPVVGGAELLGELTRFYLTIGVAGSHGKTTTASMLANILRRAGLQPSTLIGGWREGRAQAELDEGELLVVEADEFDRSFLHLYPGLAVVTGVDAEHLDCYRDLDAVEEAFGQYLARLPFYGHCVVAGDGRVGERVLAGLRRPVFTYGLGKENDFRAVDIEFGSWESRFVVERGEEWLGAVELPVPGEHNICNALGAAALALTLEVNFADVSSGLQSFTGVKRRFEKKGEVGGVLVVDDYAHHPAELAATLATTRRSTRRVVAVFQPHLYSRTRDLCDDFARELSAADEVLLADVYGSREEPLPGVDGGLIARAMQARGYEKVEFIPRKEDLTDHLLQTCRSGDLVITLGAGDIDQVAVGLLEKLRERME